MNIDADSRGDGVVIDAAAGVLQIGFDRPERHPVVAAVRGWADGLGCQLALATQGTVRAIWEILDRSYRAAMDQGLIYTRLGNPIGQAEAADKGPDRADPRFR